MKHIFTLTTSSTFYHNHFQKEVESDEPSEANKGPLNFSNFDTAATMWRIKLKVGQKIDILKFDQKYDMSMWSEGEIEAISYG
jgi:hypothetical protein